MRGYQIVRSIVHTLPKSRGRLHSWLCTPLLYWSCYFSLEPGNRSVEVTFKGVFPALVLTSHLACPRGSHTLLSDFSVVMNGSLETLNPRESKAVPAAAAADICGQVLVETMLSFLWGKYLSMCGRLEHVVGIHSRKVFIPLSNPNSNFRASIFLPAELTVLACVV